MTTNRTIAQEIAKEWFGCDDLDRDSFEEVLEQALDEAVRDAKPAVWIGINPDEVDRKISEAVYAEADRWRAKRDDCIDGLNRKIAVLEKIADEAKLKGTLAGLEMVLKIGDDNHPEFKDIHPQMQRFLKVIRAKAKELEGK